MLHFVESFMKIQVVIIYWISRM